MSLRSRVEPRSTARHSQSNEPKQESIKLSCSVQRFIVFDGLCVRLAKVLGDLDYVRLPNF